MPVAANQTWIEDPKRLGFMLARYKFVAKMFAGMDRVAEVGCGDGFAARVVAQAIPDGSLKLIDAEPLFCREVNESNWAGTEATISTLVADVSKQGFGREEFDGVYSLDVIEHVERESEVAFVANIAAALKPDGIAIIGTPNQTAEQYASPMSKAGHVNLLDAARLQGLIASRFHRVLMFGMNDEVLHTGFSPMAHYLIAMGIGPRR